MIALLDRVILDVSPCPSWLWILLSSPFLPVRSLLRNQLWQSYGNSFLGNCLFLLLLKIISLSLILGNVIMMWLVCTSLGPTSLGFYELPGLPRNLFPLLDWESSPSLCFQISFPYLALPLLLLAPLWFGCWNV